MRVALLLGVAASAGVGAAETMRIAVGPETPVAVVAGAGLSCGDDDDEAEFVALGRDRVTLRRAERGLSLDGAPLPAEGLRCRAAGPLEVNGLKVQGDVVVLRGRSQLVVVNVLPLEAYLRGVLGSEMPKSFPLEALKAQAVAARTYALNKKLEQYGQPFHLGSSVISQVYKGLEADDARTRAAIEATTGLVLTWNLQPIEAYFHASCGGRTESGAEALGRDLPYLKSVTCPCGKLPTSHWTLQVAPRELGSREGPLQVQGRTPTGRVRRVQVGPRSIDAVSFRERLGYMRLKSLAFEVAGKSRDGWVLKGHGFGHGAGLCQWGARVLADAGKDFRAILEHYYPGTELQTLYE